MNIEPTLYLLHVTDVWDWNPLENLKSTFAWVKLPHYKSRYVVAKIIFDMSTFSFLNLSLYQQDSYREHHSTIVHCRFSSNGRMVGSADADGIVK